MAGLIYYNKLCYFWTSQTPLLDDFAGLSDQPARTLRLSIGLSIARTQICVSSIRYSIGHASQFNYLARSMASHSVANAKTSKSTL
jgi:hypothetical protein